jgi:hypothetical protein
MNMITRLGMVGLLLVVLGLLLVLEVIPLDQPLRSLLAASSFAALGILTLARTDRVLSPVFASSRFYRWMAKIGGLYFLLLGVGGLVRVEGEMLGFW